MEFVDSEKFVSSHASEGRDIRGSLRITPTLIYFPQPGRPACKTSRFHQGIVGPIGPPILRRTPATMRMGVTNGCPKWVSRLNSLGHRYCFGVRHNSFRMCVLQLRMGQPTQNKRVN